MKTHGIILLSCATFGLLAPLARGATPAGTATAVGEIKQEEGGAYSFADTDIALALSTLARRAGVNLILGDNITGKVTVYLEKVSPKEAMRLIAESRGYVFQEEKNVVRVRTKEDVENEPLMVRVCTLKYAKAEDIQKVLGDLKSTRGKVQVDPRSNALVISDTEQNLAKIIPVVEALDTQTPQVMIEAKFLETTKNPRKDLGINWTDTLAGHRVTIGGKPLTGGGGGAAAAATGPFIMQPAPGIVGSWLGSSVAVLDLGQASAVFSFLISDKDTELLANPRVVTTDNGKARINITQQFPIPQFTFSEATASFQLNGFMYKDIGITLNVTPRINRDNFITLEVAPEVSDSNQTKTFASQSATFEIPIIETRNLTTTVLIKSGYTLAMGGLIREEVIDSYTKVPVVGDVPLLGLLFRSKNLEKRKRNLLVFLTPTVLDPQSAQPTGFESQVHGMPKEEIYVNDTWMPYDNAKPRDLFKPRKPSPNSTPAPKKAPSTNFGPR